MKVKTWVYGLLFFLVLFSTDASAQNGQLLKDRLKERLKERRAGQADEPAQGLKAKLVPQLPQHTMHEILVDGNPRTYLVHLPPKYDPKTKLPLVLAFHGGGGNSQNMVHMSGFSDKADAENFIVVYPNGSGRFGDFLLTYNALGCCEYAMEHEIDDVQFVSLLIDKLVAEWAVDPTRVFATGFSNGACLSHLLAAEIPEKLAAIAPVAGAIFESTPQPKGKVPVLIVHGEADTAVPVGGGNSQREMITRKQSQPFRSVSDAVEYWVKVNGCQLTPIETTDGKITRKNFAKDKSSTSVELTMVKDGLHSWPGGEKGREAADAPSTDLNATDEIWEFFKRHRKEKIALSEK